MSINKKEFAAECVLFFIFTAPILLYAFLYFELDLHKLGWVHGLLMSVWGFARFWYLFVIGKKMKGYLR